MKHENYQTIDQNGDNDKQGLFDDIVEKNGYSRNQICAILLSFLIFFIDGLQMMLTNCLFIPLKNYWHVSDFLFAFISSIIYIGFALGSIFSGKATQVFERKYIIFFTTLFTAFLQIGLSFTLNMYALLFIRFSIGFLVGLNVIISSNHLIEFLPIRFRSFVFNSVWAASTISTCYVLGLMLIFTPNFESGGVPYVLTLCAVPNLILCSIFFFIYTESPRYLIILNKNEEAFLIITKMAHRDLDEAEKQRILTEINEGINRELDSSIKDMFLPIFLRTTILLLIIWILMAYIFFSASFTYQFTIDRVTTVQKHHLKPKEIIIIQLIISLLSATSYFLAGGLGEIKKLGRIYTGLIFYSLVLIFFILTVSFRNHFAIFTGLISFFLNGGIAIITNYSSEVYPTKIRDTALGFLYFCYKISVFVSQYGSIGLERIMLLLSYYVSIGLTIVICIAILLLPFETHGNPVDFDYQIKNKDKV